MSPLGVRQWNHTSVSAVGMDFCSFRAIGAGRIGGNLTFYRGPATPVIMNALRSNSPCRRCSLGVAARRRQEDDEPADDLDDSTQLVLSMLSLASVVVDDQDGGGPCQSCGL